MHLWSLPALVLTILIKHSTLATPIAEPQLLPRNHVECDPTSHLCQIQQTCANAPTIVAGTVPEPWPSSITPFVNPVSAVETVIPGASEASRARRRLSRQPNPAPWCALGTEVYILLALQGTGQAAAVKSILGTAIQEVEAQMAAQTVMKSKTAIAAGSAPVYSLAASGSKISASNMQGASMTWLELELGLLLMADWMGKNTYGWGSASVWNATDEVGIIYITI